MAHFRPMQPVLPTALCLLHPRKRINQIAPVAADIGRPGILIDGYSRARSSALR